MSKPRVSLLPSLSIGRPITVSMMLLTLLVLGAIAYTRIPIALFPEGFEMPSINIGVSFPNANPSDTEDQVTKKIEEALGTVPGIKRVLSTSYSSYSNVNVSLHSGVDLSEAYREISDRMERVMPEMPDEVERINIYKFGATDIPILWMAMSMEDPSIDVDHVTERYILPALQRIKGVGKVESNGIRGREIRVELDLDKIKAHQVNVFQLSQKLRQNNFNLSAGNLYEGGRELFARSLARPQDLETFENLSVDPKNDLRLKDIATVGFKPYDDWQVFSLGKNKSYGIAVTRSSGANIVEVCSAVEKALTELEGAPHLGSPRFHIFWNQGKHVSESVDNLKQSGLWGGLFSIIVLYLFLRTLKMTLTITLAIPLSIMTSITALYFFGWSLNMATMMGLLLSVGLVVDNSIVIVENIHVQRALGLNPDKAAVHGASEMGMAITLATLTTIVVFLPLILMGEGNETQFWLLRIGLPVMISLTASLIIALLLIPLATKVFAEKIDPSRETGVPTRVARWYECSLRWTLNHRSYVSILLFSFIGLSFAVPFKKISQNTSSGVPQKVGLRYEFPGGQKMPEIAAYLSEVFDYIESKQPVYNYEAYSSRYSASEAHLELHFNDTPRPWYIAGYQEIGDKLGFWKRPHLTRSEIIEDLRKNISAPPGSKLKFSYKDQDPTQSFNVTLYGDDTDTLRTISEEVARRLRTVEGLIAVETDEDMSRQELNITIDREKALQLGIDTRTISGAISHTARGSEVGYFYDPNGRRVKIRVWVEEEDRETISQLKKLAFPGSGGAQVPLESLVAFSYEEGANSIRRQDRKTIMRVRGIAAKKDSKELFQQTDAVMTGLDLPRGYRWDKGGQFQQMQEQNETFQFTLAMIVIFVILLMGAMFESFLLPFCVFFTMPLAGIGVVWTLYLTHTPFNMMAIIGIIILLGVVVNNGIVLIDLVRRLQAEGISRTEAIVEAGKRRFRPIWMTSLTTIFGMIPMSLGDTKMIDMPYSPLGRAMIGGLVTSTILTLLIVPLFYTLLDDLRTRFFGYIHSIFSKRASPSSASKQIHQT